jgi:TolB-like protein/Flp pilus assembly protein TadD
MGDPSPGTPAAERASEKRLDSWKAIATYLNRDVTTVQRWEKREGMPVHRHRHSKGGSVYALSGELDAWLESRRLRLEEEQQEPEAATRTPTPVTGSAVAGPEEQPPARRRLVLGGVAVVAAVLLAIGYGISRRPAGNAAPAGPPKIRSLAVLPLKNLSGDAAQEYLAEGMTEALIGRLARIHDLRVVSHTSVMRFKDPRISTPEIAKTLGVDAIVEGSVTREGNRIRVTAQLIRAATDEHLWSETYDRDLRDALALESELAQAIAGKVEVTVTGAEQKRLAASRPVAPEVYENYLKGWFNYHNTYSRAGIEKSVGYFQAAIQKDPTFAPAYVGLAESYSTLGTVFIGAPPGEARAKELSAAQKALELDPELAEAHALLGDVKQAQWQWADAQAEYRRAIELDPNDADAYAGLAHWMLCQGRTQEALEWASRGREIDPIAVDGVDVAWILFQSRRYDEAVHELRSVLAVKPAEATALWDLGFVYVAKNQPQDAIAALEKALSISKRSPGVIGVLIGAYARAGRRGDALRLLAELKRRSRTGYVPTAAFVNAYLGLGEKDQAFASLEQACKEHSNILQYVKVHPYFDSLRGDPRFDDLVRCVGLD